MHCQEDFCLSSAGRSERHSRQYRFGEYTLDLEGGFLRRGDEEVALRAKSLEVLTYLVERHGRMVTKTELIEGVWRDAAVTDNSLAQCLVEIRRALDDDAQRLIRTVARRGYIFVAPVTVPAVEFPRSKWRTRMYPVKWKRWPENLPNYKADDDADWHGEAQVTRSCKCGPSACLHSEPKPAYGKRRITVPDYPAIPRTSTFED